MTKLKKKILIKESRTKIKIKSKEKMIKAQISKTKFNMHFFCGRREKRKGKRFIGDKPLNR
jgi:hypothetical protein